MAIPAGYEASGSIWVVETRVGDQWALSYEGTPQLTEEGGRRELRAHEEFEPDERYRLVRYDGVAVLSK